MKRILTSGAACAVVPRRVAVPLIRQAHRRSATRVGATVAG